MRAVKYLEDLQMIEKLVSHLADKHSHNEDVVNHRKREVDDRYSQIPE